MLTIIFLSSKYFVFAVLFIFYHMLFVMYKIINRHETLIQGRH